MVRLLNIDEPTAKSVLRAPIATLIAARKKLYDSLDSSKESNKLEGIEEGTTLRLTDDANEASTTATLPTTAATESLQDDVTQSNPLDSSKESNKLEGIEEGKTVRLTDDSNEASTIVTLPTTAPTESLLDGFTQSNGTVSLTSDRSGVRSMDIDEDSLSNISSEVQVVDAQQSLNAGSKSSFHEGKVKAARPGMDASEADIDRWASQGFTSLLVAAPEVDPWTVAEQLLPLLSSSSPFVIYHSYQQPLAECMHQLQIKNMAVALQLSEPWSREYQVLPSRTHPHMQMSATGGYTLSGILIVSGGK